MIIIPGGNIICIHRSYINHNYVKTCLKYNITKTIKYTEVWDNKNIRFILDIKSNKKSKLYKNKNK